MAGRFNPAMLATMRARVAAGQPVQQDRDGPGHWARRESSRLLRVASQALSTFNEHDRRFEESEEAEVTTYQLAVMLDDQTVRKGGGAGRIFGPAQSGRYDPRQRVYSWREVREKVRRLMIARLIQRLAGSLGTEE